MKLPRPRFSLRTLVVFLLLVTSGVGLWWHWEAWAPAGLLLPKNQERTPRAFFTCSGRRIVVSFLGLSSAEVWDAAGLKHIANLGSGEVGNRNEIGEPALAAGGRPLANRFLISGVRQSEDYFGSYVQVWDTEKLALSVDLEGVSGLKGVRGIGLCYSPDGKRVVTGHFSADAPPTVWDAETGKTMAVLTGYRGGDPEVRYEGADGMLYIVEKKEEEASSEAVTVDGRRVRAVFPRIVPVRVPVLGAHSESVTSVMYSADGRRILTTSEDRTAKVWDASTWELLVTLKEHEGAVNSGAFSPDGLRVVTAGEDKMARVWDAATGELLATTGQHDNEIEICVFSQDGERILTEAFDSVRVWNATSGQCLFTIPGSCDGAGYTPDGQRIMACSPDIDVTRLYDSDTGELLAELCDAAGGEDRVYISWGAASPSLRPHAVAAQCTVDCSRVIVPSAEHEGFVIWRRRRPEWWWGMFYLWEFWLTVVLAGVFTWSVWRDRKALREQVA